MTTQFLVKDLGQTWEDYMNTIEDSTLKSAIECYIAMWYPNHNKHSNIEVSQFTSIDDFVNNGEEETEEDIQRCR